jgi:hypothetical protein
MFRVTGSQGDEYLTYEVMKGSHHLYTMVLMKVGSREAKLDAGRFERYDQTPKEFGVDINFTKASLEECQRRMADYVTWIHTRGDQAWSLDITAHSVGDFCAHFSFEHLTTAVTFKLVWF